MANHHKPVEYIARTLLEAEGFVTLGSIALQCELTSRSIQNHVKKLEAWLAENNFSSVSIDKKPGRGIRLVGDERDREDLKRVFTAMAGNNSGDMERRSEELRMLLFSGTELTIGFLADHFYMSRAAVLKDLEWLEGWLRQYGLKLFKIQHMGIGVSGDEMSKRNALAAFSDIFKPGKNGACGMEGVPNGRERVYASLGAHYPKIDIGAMAKLIEEAEAKFDFYLTNDYFSTLLTHLAICVSRIKSGHETEDCVLDMAEFSSVVETATFIARGIERRYKIRFPFKELAYICLHLMGYAMRTSLEQEEIKNGETAGDAEALAADVVNYVEGRLSVRFSGDKLLFIGLAQHMRTSLYRIKNKVRINYLEMPETADDLISAVRAAASLYERFTLGLKAPEEELSAIALHFTLSEKRLKQKARAVLLSAPGVLSGEMLRKQLLDVTDGLEVTDIVNSVAQLEWLPESRYDFIISFTDYNHKSKPVISLQYVKESSYREFLSDFISKYARVLP